MSVRKHPLADHSIITIVWGFLEIFVGSLSAGSYVQTATLYRGKWILYYVDRKVIVCHIFSLQFLTASFSNGCRRWCGINLCIDILHTHETSRQTWGLSETSWKKLIDNEVGGMCHQAAVLIRFEDTCLPAYWCLYTAINSLWRILDPSHLFKYAGLSVHK